MTSMASTLPQTINLFNHHARRSVNRYVLVGGCLAYAHQNQFDPYIHFPLAFFFPVIYTSYHVFVNKEAVKEYTLGLGRDIGQVLREAVVGKGNGGGGDGGGASGGAPGGFGGGFWPWGKK